MASKSPYRRLLAASAVTATLAVCLWVGYRTWPRTINTTLPSCLPAISLEGNRWQVRTRAGALLAGVADFRSELQAYLHFEYLSSHIGLASSQILLTAKAARSGPVYRIFLVLDNNLLSAVPYLARLRAQGFISHFVLDPVPQQELAYRRLETAVFLNAYNPPVPPRLDSISPAQLLAPLTRFLMFKSETDRRVREKISPVPTALSEGQARELATDIITVARFYHLPLGIFLGIGAMENNYMNVRGDLDHAIWKRRPQRGDIILERRGGRVLVSDYAMGVWQITRETLRYAHRLYLADQRDYSALPPRLRPSKKLSFDLENSEVLTTYAGLLLRHLLDETHGDLQKAVGAYNGSLRTPNLQYAAGVRAVALYARSFLERAANLDGTNVAETWLLKWPSVKPNEEIAEGRPTLGAQRLHPDQIQSGRSPHSAHSPRAEWNPTSKPPSSGQNAQVAANRYALLGRITSLVSPLREADYPRR